MRRIGSGLIFSRSKYVPGNYPGQLTFTVTNHDTAVRLDYRIVQDIEWEYGINADMSPG